MIDIKIIRENPELVKNNIKKKFQDEKLMLVDEIIKLDSQQRKTKTTIDDLRNERNVVSKNIGILFAKKKNQEAEQQKEKVNEINEKLLILEKEEESLSQEIKQKMLLIPISHVMEFEIFFYFYIPRVITTPIQSFLQV